MGKGGQSDLMDIAVVVLNVKFDQDTGSDCGAGFGFRGGNRRLPVVEGLAWPIPAVDLPHQCDMKNPYHLDLQGRRIR
jgi:hypothetical protein